MEGVLIPPIKLYERGKLNKAAFRIITRNSRLSEHLAGDMDAEIGAARLGSRRIVALAERYGIDALEAAFDQILEEHRGDLPRARSCRRSRTASTTTRTTSRPTGSTSRGSTRSA